MKRKDNFVVPKIETFKYVVTHYILMNIEKRKFGKKIKYYLSYSYREGLKTYKLRKYLGHDLTKEKLKERVQIAEKLILEEAKKVFDDIGLERYCCRALFLGHVDLLETVARFKRA